MNFRNAIIIFFLLLTTGISGYMYLEGYGFIDGLYMTIISITTVGYGEVRTLSPEGKLFTIGLILGGVGYVGFIASNSIAFIVNGELNNIFRKKKMNKIIGDLNDHIIVCGYGQVGKEACLQLKEEKQTFVIIEKNLDKIQAAMKNGFLAIYGDSTEENTLNKAEVSKAKGLITTLSNTSENTFVTLAVKEINENIFVIARGTDERSEKILYRAGVDKVISPARIGGKEMVSTICHSPTLDFIVSLVQDRNIDIKFAEIIIKKGCSLIGETLAGSNIKKLTDGIMVVGVKPIDSGINLNPSPDTLFNSEDKLILLGTENQITKLRKLANISSSEIKYLNNK